MKTKPNRGKRNSHKNVTKSLVLVGINPDGAKSKWTTIKKLIRDTNATILTMQETKSNQTGLLKLNDFFVYEHTRKNQDGGGVALCARKELCPAFVREGGEEAEAVTVVVHLKEIAVSVTSAYGPQETAPIEKKTMFWKYLTEDAERARDEGKGFILQGDLNSFLGPDMLPGDVHPQNRNGKLFSTFLANNRLTCVNSLDITNGLITRTRKVLNEIKESTIDFFVVCERVLPFVINMKIDNHKQHTLTNFKEGEDSVDSDHLPLVMKVNLQTVTKKKERIEILDINNKKQQQTFKINTSETEDFTNCFKGPETVLEQCGQWISTLKSHCKKSFQTIRIRPKRIQPSKADSLINKRNKQLKLGKYDQVKLMDENIAQIVAEEGRAKAKMFERYSDQNGSNSVQEMWKLKKKLFPKKASVLPSAKLNYQGRVVTEPNELTKLLGEEYGKIRLRKRPTHPKNIKTIPLRKKIIQLKLKIAKKRKTPPFKMEDLDLVLKMQQSGKARDPEGMSKTIFKQNIIGTNLKDSMLIMFNKLKDKNKIPQFMRKVMIKTIPKKGSKIVLKNERGIFLVNSVRNIFMRLLFNLNRHTIEKNMSDSNVGGRQNKSGINHIWVMNSVIHDTLSSVKKKPVIFQKYDYTQMFDGMNSEEACGDIFDYGVNNNHLSLIHEANSVIHMNVNTEHGKSKEYVLTHKAMQGDTWAGVNASAQVDAFGKQMLIENPSYIFKFKDKVPVPLLGMVDDTICITEAGHKTDQFNAYLNVKSADKNLQFGADKCNTMVVSKRVVHSFQQPNLEVDTWDLNIDQNNDTSETFSGKTKMTNEKNLTYLGFVLSHNGSNMPNINHKYNKALGTQKQIKKMIQHLGPYTFECGLIYTASLIRTSILYAAETMYNVLETEYRALERIEESTIQDIFQTKKTCGRHILYLEAGVYPARYQIHRMMLNLLQYILQQPKDSLLYRVFDAEKNCPTRNDWVSSTFKLLEKYEIKLNEMEIKEMSRKEFKKLTKTNTRKIAFQDLKNKQENGSKGKFIEYETLTIADYLKPECQISTEDKRLMFSLRTEMNDIPSNFGNQTQCEMGCNKILTNKHIFNCEILNSNQTNTLEYTNILNGNLNQKIEILTKMKLNITKMKQMNKLSDSVDIY